MDIESAAFGVLEGGSGEKTRVALETLQKLLTNIQRSPTETKFRQVRKSNAAIQSRLFPQCFDFLAAVGFKDVEDNLVFEANVGPEFGEAVAIIESLLSSFVTTGTPASGASSSAVSPARTAPKAAPSPDEARKTTLQRRQEKAKDDAQKSQTSAQEQLSALRQSRAGRYQEEQNLALAQHLSGLGAETPFDPISSLNAARGSESSFVTCTRCGDVLRYDSATRASAVLCPCGMLLQPIHLRGQPFPPRSVTDLPIEPGVAVAGEERSRTRTGPFITVTGPGGEPMRMPLHEVLQMVRQHERGQAHGAEDQTIEALPTRTFDASSVTEGAGKEGNNCQICMEDFKEGDELRTLPCFHLFHSECVGQWLKVNSVCPTCRHKVG